MAVETLANAAVRVQLLKEVGAGFGFPPQARPTPRQSIPDILIPGVARMPHGRHGYRSSLRNKGIRLATAVLLAAMLCSHPLLRAQSLAVRAVVVTFDIPAQPLSSALRQFAQQSRKEILFTPGLVAGKRSQGVVGSLPPLQALEALLRNTGLTFSTTPAGAILLHDSMKSPDNQ